MCIIVVKGAGVALPHTDVLKECFTSNPDGAGIAWYNQRAGVIEVIKGLFTFDDFNRQLMNVISRLALLHQSVTETPMMFHFRIATSGNIDAGTCHPFPLSDDFKRLTASKYTCELAICHNGVFKGFDYRPAYSDTQSFIHDVLAPVFRGRAGLPHDVIAGLIEGFNCRLAVMDLNGDIHTYGVGWCEEDGVLYSNTSYKPARDALTRWRACDSFYEFMSDDDAEIEREIARKARAFERLTAKEIDYLEMECSFLYYDAHNESCTYELNDGTIVEHFYIDDFVMIGCDIS